MLKELRGSDVIIECLLEQGVDTVFGYPGGAVLNIYDSLYKYSDRIHHVITAHEQAACHAADGYSRTTGRTGVVIATSGPGATNLVTGIATAYMDSIPMVAITGNVTRDLLGLDSFQEVDICGITMPITKHNYIVKDPAELADIIREAFYIANEGRKGPVLIDIPKDITGALMVYEKKEPKKVVNHNPEGINEEIAAAAELIKNAEKPFIYAGGGVVSADATEEMAEFVRKVDAPVSLSLMGQCALDNTKDCYIGMLGMHGTKTAAMTLSECDLMIVLGSRFSDRVLCNAKTFAKDKRIIHIDIDPAEIGKNIPVDIPLVGDCKAILSELTEMITPCRRDSWLEELAEIKNAVPENEETNGYINPKMFLRKLSDKLPANTVCVADVGQNQIWCCNNFAIKEGGRFLTTGGMGTMGYSVPCGVGAKMAAPDREVVVVCGDGSFQMQMMELATIMQEGIAVKIIIMRNNRLGMVRELQTKNYEDHQIAVHLDGSPDFVALARSYGIEADRVVTMAEAEEKIDKLVNSDKPYLLECNVYKLESTL